MESPYFGITVIIIAIVGLFLWLIRGRISIKSHWRHFYDNIQFSALEFYEQVKAGLAERNIEGIRFSSEEINESHVLSAKRVYLNVGEKEYEFYICAAPFGTGTFVSWWLCIRDEQLINRIPVLSTLFGIDRSNKTFYQMDTEAMYLSAIHTVVVSVADSLTSVSGYRLSETDRQYIRYKEISVQ